MTALRVRITYLLARLVQLSTAGAFGVSFLVAKCLTLVKQVLSAANAACARELGRCTTRSLGDGRRACVDGGTSRRHDDENWLADVVSWFK
jgi:hypothetical protein